MAAESPNLQAAFKAVFLQLPPKTRDARFPGPNGGKVTYQLKPVLLVHLEGTHFALIISESFPGAHYAAGAVAVAYLTRNAEKWQPVQVWYELAQAGSFGVPFVDQQSFRFDKTPFFAGDSEYCGMGACTDWYSMIGLYPNGPAYWGVISKSGALEPGSFTIPDADGLIGCGGYGYSSFISAPERKGALMQVNYKGWLTPGGQNRRDLEGSTDVFLKNGKLKLSPKLSLPNCGN